MDKTEREKMLANELYLASDPELYEMYLQVQRLLYRFNATAPDELALRQELIRSLFGEVGANPVIQPNFRCDYGRHIFAKDNLYMNYDCVILDCNRVEFGNNVMLAPGVHIYAAYHPLSVSIRRTGLELAAPVSIGDDVWIGGRAIICPGVRIGDGSTIGAGSVVTRDVPPNVFAAGNPCRVIRELSPEERVPPGIE
ncbi:MAG: sugar O-acetyltransferase [Thainema sp.]